MINRLKSIFQTVNAKVKQKGVWMMIYLCQLLNELMMIGHQDWHKNQYRKKISKSHITSKNNK